MDSQMAKLKMAAMGPKVDHPLAKYTSKGELLCILCNQKIKSSNVWKVHLSCKAHKEKLILFKTGNLKSTPSNKRPPSPTPPRSLKKNKPEKPAVIKSIVSDNSGNEIKSILKQSSKTQITKLPPGFVAKSRKLKEEHVPVEQIRKIEENSKLPIVFFDNDITPSTMEEDEEDEQKQNAEGEISNEKPLPEGFFDDARQDAKARHVEYKDPKDVEWEKFKVEMEHEDIRYETIIEEDDQKLHDERDYEIEIEQKQWNYRVESINHSATTGEIAVEDKNLINFKIGKVEKEDDVKIEPGETSMEVEMEGSLALNENVKMEESDSEDDDFLLNWRTKSALR